MVEVKSLRYSQEVKEFLNELADEGYDLRQDIISITYDDRYSYFNIFYIKKEDVGEEDY